MPAVTFSPTHGVSDWSRREETKSPLGSLLVEPLQTGECKAEGLSSGLCVQLGSTPITQRHYSAVDWLCKPCVMRTAAQELVINLEATH